MSYLNVTLDTDHLETETLIDIIERRGYEVLMPGETDENVVALNKTVDEIHDLYHAFLAWKDFGNKNENFESDLKKFFLETIDMKVI